MKTESRAKISFSLSGLMGPKLKIECKKILDVHPFAICYRLGRAKAHTSIAPTMKIIAGATKAASAKLQGNLA